MGVPAKRSERVEVIDALRGVAALAVVLYHYAGLMAYHHIPVGSVSAAALGVIHYGRLGVPVFFVLSGFVIAMTASRYTLTPATGGRFVLRRLVRIVPPYWAMIGLITTAILAGHVVGLFRNTTVTPDQILVHLVYLQDILDYPALDPAYWTLCLEVQFYLVFTLSAVCLRAWSPTAQAAWFAVLTGGSLWIHALNAVPAEYFPRLWYQFGIGVLAYSASRTRVGGFALGVLLPAALVLAVTHRQAEGYAVTLVAGLLLLRQQRWVVTLSQPVFLQKLGGISYSLYLVHGLIGMVLAAWFRAAGVRSEIVGWSGIAVATTAAIAFAAVFYAVCERRAMGWSHRVRVNAARDEATRAASETFPDTPPDVAPSPAPPVV